MGLRMRWRYKILDISDNAKAGASAFDSPGCFMLKPTGPVSCNLMHSCQFCD